MDPAYRKKVVFEFTRAAAAGRGKGMPPGSGRDNSLVGGGRKRKEAERDDLSEDTFEDEGDHDDDAMERALEAMIDAKMGGDGDDFRDDFDDADEGVDAEEATGLGSRWYTAEGGEAEETRVDVLFGILIDGDEQSNGQLLLGFAFDMDAAGALPRHPGVSTGTNTACVFRRAMTNKTPSL